MLHLHLSFPRSRSCGTDCANLGRTTKEKNAGKVVLKFLFRLVLFWRYRTLCHASHRGVGSRHSSEKHGPVFAFFFASSRCCESIDVPCVPLSVYHKLMYGTRYEGGMGFRLERSWDLCSSRNIMFFIPFLCADRKRLVRKSSQTYT